MFIDNYRIGVTELRFAPGGPDSTDKRSLLNTRGMGLGGSHDMPRFDSSASTSTMLDDCGIWLVPKIRSRMVSMIPCTESILWGNILPETVGDFGCAIA